jgi:ribosome recycling factor
MVDSTVWFKKKKIRKMLIRAQHLIRLSTSGGSGARRLHTFGMASRSSVCNRDMDGRKKGKGKQKGGRGKSKNNNDEDGERHSIDEIDAKEMERRMQKSVEVLSESYVSLRSRASPAILDSVHVRLGNDEAPVPLDKLALVTQKDSSSLRVAVFDANHVGAVERAIQDHQELDLMPQADGTQLHVPVPKPTRELREQLAKMAAERAEQTRIAIRNSRQKTLTQLKRIAKSMPKNEVDALEREIQHITDEQNRVVANLLKQKQQELER